MSDTAAGTPVSTFSEMAHLILTTAAEALGEDVPGRVFVAHGTPAWETCGEDQLTVHTLPVQFKSKGHGRNRLSVPDVTYHLQIARRVPNDPTGTSADALDRSGTRLLDDLDLIQNAVRAATYPWVMTYGAATPVGPLGGIGAYDWPITWTAG